MSISNPSSFPLTPTNLVVSRPPSSQPPQRADRDGDVDPSTRASGRDTTSKPAERADESRQAAKYAGPPKADAAALAQAEIDQSLKASKDAQIAANAKQTATATQAAHNAYGSTKALFG